MKIYISIDGLPESFFIALDNAGLDVRREILDGGHYYKFGITAKDTELRLYSDLVYVTEEKREEKGE